MSYDVSDPVPIPADIEIPDKILAGLTARQVAIAAAAAVIIWTGWVAARHVMPLPAFAALAAPAALAATALVIGERDGLSLDRLLAAAWRQARSSRRLVTAPEGIPAAPAWAAPPSQQAPAPAPLAPLWRHIGADGVIGLGGDGAAAVAAVSTVNFALRSPAEQDALTAAYGRWLNSLTGPVQVVIRAGRGSPGRGGRDALGCGGQPARRAGLPPGGHQQPVQAQAVPLADDQGGRGQRDRGREHREGGQRQDVAGGLEGRPHDHRRGRGDGDLPGGEPGQDLVGPVDVGRDRHRVADVIAHGPLPFFPFAEADAAALPRAGVAPRSSGATRDSTAAVNANRTARRTGEWPNGDSTGRAIQNGIRISTYSRHSVIRICSR